VRKTSWNRGKGWGVNLDHHSQQSNREDESSHLYVPRSIGGEKFKGKKIPKGFLVTSKKDGGAEKWRNGSF